MPATSKAQKIAACLALAAKDGKVPVSRLQGSSLSMYKSMSRKQLEDFCGNPGIPERLLEWRRRQKRGAIMKPATFEKIVKKCMADNPTFSRARCEKVAGSAYWKTARKKYKGA